MIRVIDDRKLLTEAIERGLHEEETLSQLYELIRGFFNLDELYLIDSKEITQLIGERSGALSSLIDEATPLLNHLISSEAPSHFGYFRCASLISMIIRGELAADVFREFETNKAKALDDLSVAQNAENKRLKEKYM